VTNFTPLSALAGGVLIGASASALLLLNGRIAGITGIFRGALVPTKGDAAWRFVFLAGLFAGGLLLTWMSPAAIEVAPRPLAVTMIAGLLVGFGTRLGNGCTSGHGVCGLSRLSPRSVVATMTFMAAGVVSAIACRHLLGGAP
jgi:hypothetical protein